MIATFMGRAAQTDHCEALDTMTRRNTGTDDSNSDGNPGYIRTSPIFRSDFTPDRLPEPACTAD